MATKKQTAANQANAQKSTGAKTPEGKAVVATNAVRHGLLASRLFLTGEDPAEFAALQDDLRAALRPAGMLELALVEKIAVALWKQRRLVTAETAALELGRRMEQSGVRQAMSRALDDNLFNAADWEPPDQDTIDRQKWRKKVVAEFEAVDDLVLESNDLVALAKEAPLLSDHFNEEAEQEDMTAEAYLGYQDNGLVGWAYELRDWCEKELAKEARRPLIQSVTKLVQAEKSAPITNQLMMRYQVALDGELYRAMDSLRKQQEWRIKAGIEGEAVEA